MTDQRGSLTAFLAVLATGLFVVVGLVVDGGRAIAAKREAADVAEQAARVGADQLSIDDLRAGRFVVDPQAASNAVAGYLSVARMTGHSSVSGDSVTVHVSDNSTTAVLGIIGIRVIPVSATASATNLHGVTKEDQ
ncbi:MAG TPA: pilus assembly protein TadG-related protein [Acidimicrobiales bacterium]|nr:pilus assembly protein TadG-related protein [Acidimicrobiales bacterium]